MKLHITADGNQWKLHITDDDDKQWYPWYILW